MASGLSRVKRPQLKDRGDLQEDAGYVTVGAYQHGGIVGVTNFTKNNPEFAAKAAELMAMVFPDEVFTSITVVRDARMPLHRDVYNDKTTYNLIVPCASESGCGSVGRSSNQETLLLAPIRRSPSRLESYLDKFTA